MNSSPLGKFFCRLSVMAVAVLTPLFLLNAFYVQTEHFRTENGVDGFVNVPWNLDLVNTGSSHGKYAFRYERLEDVSGFNLAMESQPFLYDSAMLKEFSNHLRPGAVVLLSVSIESFHRHPGSMPQIRPRYYRILSCWNNPEWHLGDAFRHSFLPVLGAGRNIKAIWRDAPWGGGEAFLGSSLGRHTPEELTQLARIRYKDFQVVVINQARKDVQDANVKLLEAMIRMCRESGWVPVLVNTPFIRALNEQFDDSFKTQFMQRLRAVREATGNPPLLDYSDDARFVDSPEFFADVDHLNAEGAALLTAQVVTDLRARNLLGGRACELGTGGATE